MQKTLTVAALAISASILLAPANAAHPKSIDHGKMDHEMSRADLCGMGVGEGVINVLDVKKSEVNISHGPIEAIGWPQMKMAFAVAKPVDLAAFAVGEKIHFLLSEGKDKSYSVVALCSLEADDGAYEACMGKMHETAMKAAENAGTPCPLDDMTAMDHDGGSMKDGVADAHHDSHH